MSAIHFLYIFYFYPHRFCSNIVDPSNPKILFFGVPSNCFTTRSRISFTRKEKQKQFNFLSGSFQEVPWNRFDTFWGRCLFWYHFAHTSFASQISSQSIFMLTDCFLTVESDHWFFKVNIWNLSFLFRDETFKMFENLFFPV